MVNLERPNLDEDEAGRGEKTCGEYGSGSGKLPPILGEGRSSVAFLRCIDGASSNIKNGGLLLELSGTRVKTESETKASKGKER